MKKLISFLLCILLGFSSVPCMATEARNADTWLSNFGAIPDNSIILDPFGLHTLTASTGVSMNYLLGVLYEGVYATTFINSFGDRVVSAGLARNIFKQMRFSSNFYMGLMAGYKGNLADVGGIPFRNTFLWEGNINPVAAIDLNFKINEKFEISSIITPLVILGGIKYNF